MKRKLLLELNEMRKMMGLSLLVEQVTPTTKKVLNLLGYTDSSIDNLAKQVDLSDLSKISDEFASMGIKTMEDWQTLASKQGIDLKTATDDQILKLIDSTPNLKSSILKSYNDKVVKLTNELIANTDVKSFLPTNMQTEITTVMSKELTDENSDIIIKLVDSQLEKLDKLFDNLQKSKVEIPEPLQKLYDNLVTKKEDALNFKTKKSTQSTPQNVSKNTDTNIKWGNLGNGYTVSNQITDYSGRYVVIVKEPSGRLRPFYQRTGGGGADQGWASAGNWVPFYGIADVSIITDKGLTKVNGWMIKPDNGRMGEPGDDKISQLLGDVVGTNGIKNVDYAIGNFLKMMTNTPTPSALNDFLRAQGYDITPTNGALSKFQEPNILHGIP
jgi:hypothetical protein